MGFLLRWWKLKTISLHIFAISAYCIKEQMKKMSSGNFTSPTTFLILQFSKFLTNTLETKDTGEIYSYKQCHMKCFRYLDKICTVGFEPNMMHQSRLDDLKQSYKNCGWNVSRRNFHYSDQISQFSQFAPIGWDNWSRGLVNWAQSFSTRSLHGLLIF